MAEVIRRNELIINSIRYPLAGEVVRKLTSQFAEKMVVGAYDTDSMKRIDTWEVPLYPGYVGVQEAQAKESHLGRSWWTDLITEQDGYTVLPRLATEVTIPSGGVVVYSFPYANCEATTQPLSNLTRSADFANDGTYSGKSGALNTGGTATRTGSKTITWDASYQSAEFILTAYIYTSVNILGKIGINDGVGGTTWSTEAGGVGWQQLTVTKTLNASATQLVLWWSATTTQADDGYAYFDTWTFTNTTGVTGSVIHFCNFNGELYMGKGSYLSQLNAGRTAFETVKCNFGGSVITDMFTEPNGNLLIFFGDDVNYWYMTTAEAFTETGVNDATRGITWDSKAWKMDADGNWWYSTTPAAAAPTWTAGGALADIPDQVESLFIGYDADGDDQIYCATNSILKVYDSTNAKWLSTQVKLPDHPNGGKGAAYWSGGHYLSYGLGVRKYEPIEYRDSEVGLIKDDGIPVEYNGEIVKFGAEAASNILYALIDASQTSGNSKSGLWAYDGFGWRCWWADTSNNGAMYDVIVSSASSGYAVYWDVGAKVYYINLQRGIQNPRQLAGTITYDTSGIYVSPDYDAFWPVGNKIAVQVRCSVRGDVSADETVIVSYRVNHSNTDIGTGWTALTGTITSAGETTYPMPTSAAPAGTSFRTIQLRLDFGRKAADTDETPVVVYLALDYYKVIPKSWGWAATLDLSKASYADKSSEQLVDAIITAAETESLVTLVYEDTTKYVKIEDIEISHTTGEYPKGTAKIFMTEI